MISIIVPIYGVEQYLRQCIESIIKQTYRDLEIILVDDGSPDNCGAICDEYARNDNRIKVIHKKNGGLVGARKAGLEIATGDYIGFVDGDDWIDEHMYQEIAKMIEQDSSDVILTEFYYDYNDHTDESNQIFKESFYDKIGMNNKIYPQMLFNESFYKFGVSPSCWSKVFRRELLEKNLQHVDDNIKMGEDAAFTYPCLLDANKISCIKVPLYHYRIISVSMSRGYDSSIENIIMLPYYRLKKVNERSSYDMADQLNYYLMYLVNFWIRNESRGFCRKSKKEIMNTLRRIVSNTDILNAAKSVESFRLPVHTKLIVNLIKKRCVFGLYLYTKCMSIYLNKGV